MGVIDEKKSSSGANGCHESTIPQMVITSVEGESEELKLDNDAPPASEDPQPSSEHRPDIGGQKPSVSFSIDETVIEGSVQTKPQDENINEYINENIPTEVETVIVNGSDVPQVEIGVRSPEHQEPTKSVQTTGQRPLIVDSESAKRHETAILPVESIYEVIGPAPIVHGNEGANEHEIDKQAESPPPTTITKENEGFFAKSRSFWKQDSSKPLFTFPKFNFSVKEQRDTPKVTKKKEKSKKQQYSIEMAEPPQDSVATEQYKKIEEVSPKVLDSPPAVQSTPEVKKGDRSQMIHPKTPEPKQANKAPEDDFNLQEEQEPLEKTPQGAKRANTPESLYDTCCIKFAVLLRNKAFEMAVETSKVIPPKKPPKPTVAALAKARSEITAKRLKEYQNRPHNFGDDILVGVDGIRYADEDTESSTDYKDVDNFGVIMNPECYGIIRKLKSENEDENFRAPSTCSGLTSYYTADTVTLKDENSSDNTLETVSLGSYDSVVCKASVPDATVEHPISSVDQKGVILNSHDQKSVPSSKVVDKSKKVPPPVPPKPSVLLKSIKKNTDHTTVPLPASTKDITHCINSLSLSPRPSVRTTGNSEGIKKRPLTIAGIKSTEFEQFSRSTSDSPTKIPVLNTVVKNSTLTRVRNLPLDPLGHSKPLCFSSSSKSPSSASSLPKPISKPPPPPRPPPPIKPAVVEVCEPAHDIPKHTSPPNKTVILTQPKAPLIRHHISPPRPAPPPPQPKRIPPPPPVRMVAPPPRPPPPCRSVEVSDKSGTDDPSSFKGELESLSSNNKEHEQAIESTENLPSVNKDSDAPTSEHSSCDFTCAVISPLNGTEGADIKSQIIPDSVADLEGKKEDTTIEPDHVIPPVRHPRKPRPPPRVRRNRSRTVEIVSLTSKVQENRRRSQSLSDIEDKRALSASLLAPEDSVKALYTTVNKDSLKLKNDFRSSDNELDRLSSSSEAISCRPLPPPPPPPRSKSHSASRRSKSDERPSALSSLSTSLCSISKSESMPNEINSSDKLKPPARKKKSSKQQFFSLRSHDKNHSKDSSTKFYSLRAVDSCSTPPVKPERRMKSHPSVVVDENANVADSSVIPFCSSNTYSVQPAAVSRPRVKSFGFENIPSDKREKPLLQRSKSEIKKSHSSWYDKEVSIPKEVKKENSLDDWEHLNWVPDASIDQSDSKPIQTPARTKKQRKSSTFYVEVEEDANEVETEKPCIHKEDKETSPLPLDYSEKSVQTSLETLSVGAPSRGELSDDTDDLLDLAQTLQDELKTIIKRHKSGEVFRSSDDSCSTSECSQSASHKPSMRRKKPTTLISQPRPPLDSTTSSASEIWQISSSEESEDDSAVQGTSHLSELSQTKKKRKIFYIAQEIMSSEEAFVDALRLLNVDFRAHIEAVSKQKGTAIVPDEVLNQILNHLPQLQHLNENLLMELKYRIEQWDTLNKIADVIVKMGPFLKLYSWYIQDFEATTSIMEEAKKKYPCFGQAVREYEMSPRCKRLTLNHYMLKPVQRIPQYRLLLQEYLHHLSNTSEDYEDTVEALRIVSEVANHANESMKHGDNFQKLMSIQSSIIGHKEIIKPGRMFIKEGELMKLSRKGMQPRWFVLMNDLLLYLTPVQQGLYRVNHELTLAGMKVAIPLQQDYQNEFSIISVTRSFTLSAKSHEERQEWIIALTKAIEENASKRSTFTAGRLQQKSEFAKVESLEQGFILGKTAPVWIPDARVTMCQLCTSEFTVTFRRHHCRACGKVVCSICSSNRISLQYLGNRIARVCDECYTKLGQVSSGCTESGETDSDNQQIAVKPHLRTDRHKKPKRQLPSVLKEVCANDVGSTISGYMHKRVNSSWKKSWFVVKQKVLYEFRASEDVAALRSIPLLGFQINTFTEPIEGIDPPLLFEISHPGQAPILFHAETPASAERWVKELKDATVLE